MKSVSKLIWRFVGITLLSSFLILTINLTVFVVIFVKQSPDISTSPYNMAEKVGRALQKTQNGYLLNNEMTAILSDHNVWCVLIDNDTLQVVWQTENTPASIPDSYTLSDISNLTLGYIEGYPTYTGEANDGIVVLGFPKDSYWKHPRASWDYNLIANAPQTIITVLIVNVFAILLVYVIANTKLLKSVKPITKGIQDLSVGEPVHIKESGLLSEISANINRTSVILQGQKQQLRKKEAARANWIAGVSHDIRTPLSMVMGYAGQLKDDSRLSAEERQKATVIVKQSERMRNLINDLNLASKLEYDMQPIKREKQNLVAIVRQVVVDFINMDIEEKYPIKWETDDILTVCSINADKDLIKRAISNLIQNSINHNENGCKIYVSVTSDNRHHTVVVSDDGVGATDEQIKKINNAPHYMVCDENTTDQRHGLGLLIVKQIITAHGGTITTQHSSCGGFSAKLTLPAQE